MKGRHFIVSQGTYPFDVLVSIGETDAQRLRAIKKHFPDDVLLGNEHRLETVADSILLDSLNGVISISDYPDTPEMKGWLAHEVWHIVDELFKKIEISLHLVSTEAFAYQISHLTCEIYKRLK